MNPVREIGATKKIDNLSNGVNILSVDTTSAAMSVILSTRGVIFSKTKAIGLKNYESIASVIAALIKKAKLSIEDINFFSVCIGPGSFTGIRIGLSTVKALAYAIQVPVVGYKSLDVDAWMLRDSFFGLLCVLRDARRNNVYAAVYSRDKRLRSVSRYFLCSVAELAKKIAGILRLRSTGAWPRNFTRIYFYGDALSAYRREIQSYFPHSILLPQKGHYHKARAMISLTMENIKGASTPFRLSPLYLYPRDCQVQKAVESHRQARGTFLTPPVLLRKTNGGVIRRNS